MGACLLVRCWRGADVADEGWCAGIGYDDSPTVCIALIGCQCVRCSVPFPRRVEDLLGGAIGVGVDAVLSLAYVAIADCDVDDAVVVLPGGECGAYWGDWLRWIVL